MILYPNTDVIFFSTENIFEVRSVLAFAETVFFSQSIKELKKKKKQQQNNLFSIFFFLKNSSEFTHEKPMNINYS